MRDHSVGATKRYQRKKVKKIPKRAKEVKPSRCGSSVNGGDKILRVSEIQFCSHFSTPQVKAKPSRFSQSWLRGTRRSRPVAKSAPGQDETC